MPCMRQTAKVETAPKTVSTAAKPRKMRVAIERRKGDQGTRKHSKRVQSLPGSKPGRGRQEPGLLQGEFWRLFPATPFDLPVGWELVSAVRKSAESTGFIAGRSRRR